MDRVTSGDIDIVSPGRPYVIGRPSTLNDDIANGPRRRVTSSDTDIVSPTPTSSISTSNYSETPQVRRHPGRPRLRRRSSTLNNDTTNTPRRRRRRPSSLVTSSSVRQYVGHIAERAPVNDEQTTIVSHSSGL